MIANATPPHNIKFVSLFCGGSKPGSSYGFNVSF
jgi:hypothetical protein